MKKYFRKIMFMICVSCLLIRHESHAGPIIVALQKMDNQPSLQELIPFLSRFSTDDFCKEFFETNEDIVKTNPSDEVQSKKVIISFERIRLTQSFIDCINSKLSTRKIEPKILGKNLEEDLSYLESFREELSLSDTDINAHDALTKLKSEIQKEYTERTAIQLAFRKLMETKSGKLLLIRILIAINKIDKIANDPRCPRIVIGYGKKFSVSHEKNCKSILKLLMSSDAVPAFHLEYDPTSKSLVLPIKFSLFNEPVDGISLMHTEDKVSLDLIIFHEMVHWLHKLDNLKYLSRSKIGEMDDGTISVKNHPLFLYYYGDHRSCDINTDNWKTSLIIWNNSADVHKLPPQIRVNFEEMLTICGLPDNVYGYAPGDELSENLYRTELKLPLRFGHRVITFVENEEICKRVYDCSRHYCNLLGIDTEKNIGQEKPDTYIGSFPAPIGGSVNIQRGIGNMHFYIIPDYLLKDNFNILIPERGMYVGRRVPLDSYYYFCYQDCKNIISKLVLE